MNFIGKLHRLLSSEKMLKIGKIWRNTYRH